MHEALRLLVVTPDKAALQCYVIRGSLCVLAAGLRAESRNQNPGAFWYQLPVRCAPSLSPVGLTSSCSVQ